MSDVLRCPLSRQVLRAWIRHAFAHPWPGNELLPYDSQNTRLIGGKRPQRICRTCRRLQRREKRRRDREVAC